MKRILLFILLTLPLSATEFQPWFPPLFEFQSEFSYYYTKGKQIQSPEGDFNAPSINHSAHLGLNLTPWPYWNTEVELYLTRTSEIPFSYEAALASLRYQWFDDIRGDPLTLVTGVTFSIPGNCYLHSFYYAYHGDINGEVHATLGKEWSRRCDWWMRTWVLGGWGFANRGSGWLHGIAALEFNAPPFQLGLLTEGLYGLGSHNLLPGTPFKGYASIAHRNVNIGGYLSKQIGYLGRLYLLGWYNAYAHNFPLHDWSLGSYLCIPFSF